ncbi:MAG TPA: acetyl-CoA carboxylase biotin carboxyl carrier protein [Candidatus Binatia bacterium]|nr:acetyl-CoA carboxylase biotin carboxyl carrier protein [Candidatus Binatia bacterium]
MDIAEIRKLVRVMRDHGILELELQDRRGKIRLVRDAAGERAAVGAPRAPETGRPPAPAATSELVVTSPMVGTFYRGAGPDASPFVDLGDLVEPGQVLCVIEAMKMVNEIAAEARGTVRGILVQDGTPVEYGAPLLVIEPA